MANERLRTALLEGGVTMAALAEKASVSEKTVERWITTGRKPYLRHRYVVSEFLGLDETYLWPSALSDEQVDGASHKEIITAYPHRTAVPEDSWRRLFGSAEREIGILVYAGLFLARDRAIQKIIRDKAQAGVRVRVLLGDPDCDQVARCGADEGMGDGMAAAIRDALERYRPLRDVEGVEFRFHDMPLYNSIYRADGQLLVNTHVNGLPAADAPVLHLRKVTGGELVYTYIQSFERVWKGATPA